MVTEVTNATLLEQCLRIDTLSTGTVTYDDGKRESKRFSRTKSHVVTPGYFRILKSGGTLPVLPYSLQQEVVSFGKGYPWRRYIYKPNNDRSEWYGPDAIGFSDASYLQPSAFSKTNQNNRLYNNILDKIQSEKVNIGNFVGERDQFYKLCGDSFKKIANAMKAVKHGNLPAAARFLTGKEKRIKLRDNLSQNWLQLQYGWLPLLSDIHGASQALESWPDRHNVEPTKVSSGVSLTGDDNIIRQNREHYQLHFDWAKRIGLRYTVDQGSLRFAATVGLTNPLSIAWELTPFSFVVDWALPIGKSLNNLDATIGCNFVDGYENEKLVSVIAATTSHQVWTVGQFTDQYLAEGGIAVQTTFIRSPIGGFPSVHMPTLKNPLTAQHCANALALLTQVFKH